MLKRWLPVVILLLLGLAWLLWPRSPWARATVRFDPEVCDAGGCEDAGTLGGSHGPELTFQRQPGVDDATAQLALGLDAFWTCVDERGIRTSGAIGNCVQEASFPEVCQEAFAEAALGTDGSAEALMQEFDAIFIDEEGLCDPDDS